MYPEKYIIEPSRRSPWISLETGRLFIMGRSIIENPSGFFEPALKWVSEYAREWNGRTRIDLGFEYINTGSTKWLYILLRELSELCRQPECTVIYWHYEQGDDDMRDLGFILKSLVECQFDIIETENMGVRYYRKVMAQRD